MARIFTPRIKPPLWGIRRSLVDPDWDEYWDGLTAGYMLWDGGGSTITSLTKEFSGTAVGGPTWTSEGVSFDGTDDRYDCGDNRGPSTAITMVVVIRIDSATQSKRSLIIKKKSPTAPFISYQIKGSSAAPNGFGADINVDNVNKNAFPTTQISIDRWQAVIATWQSGENLIVYHDAVEVASSGPHTGSINYAADEVRLGWNEFDNLYWNGELAIALIYDRRWIPGQVLRFNQDYFGLGRPAPRRVGKAPAVVAATDQLLLSTRGRHGGMNVLSGGMAA